MQNIKDIVKTGTKRKGRAKSFDFEKLDQVRVSFTKKELIKLGGREKIKRVLRAFMREWVRIAPDFKEDEEDIRIIKHIMGLD